MKICIEKCLNSIIEMRNLTSIPGTRKHISSSQDARLKPNSSQGHNHPRITPEQDKENPFLTPKQLPIRITPENICFENIQPNVVYSMAVTIRNQGKEALKIKISSPTTKHFQVISEPLASIASGLTLKMDVFFKGSIVNDYFDSFTIMAEGYKKVVSVSAKAPLILLTYKNLIDLLYVPVNHTTTFPLEILNTGAKGQVILNPQNKSITLYPEVFEIESNEKKQISLKIKPRNEGGDCHLIEVLANNKIEKTIQVQYQALEMDQFIMQDNKILNRVELGKIYFGKKKSLKLKLVNNTNKSTQFVSHFKRTSNAKKLSTTDDSLHEEKLYQLHPSQGRIDAFGSMDVELTLTPEMLEIHKDKVSQNARRSTNDSNSNSHMANKLKSKLKITDEEFEHSMVVKFSEKAVLVSLNCVPTIPNIKISEVEIDFANVSPGEKQDKTFTIQNFSELPIEVEFPKLLSVQIQPKKILLQSRETTLFTITLTGNTLGRLEKTQIVLLGGLYEVGLNISATVTYQNSDFKERAPDNLLSTNRIRNLLRSTTRESLHMTLEPKNAQFRRTWHKFKSGQISVPSLAKTKLPLPQSKQGLFVIRPIDKYTPIKKAIKSLTIYKDRGKRLQVHNHRELSQIEMELTKESLKEIQCNMAEVDFGNMFLKSKDTKKLQIINELLTSIQIRLETKDNRHVELSHPRTIVSPEEKGTFDVTFKAIELGEVRTSLKYIINEKHEFEVFLYAKVVPVGLELDKEILKLAFNQNLRMDIEETLTLRNPGNAIAQFHIDDTPYCKFEPSKGVLSSKESLEINITFKPLQTGVIEAGDREVKYKESFINYDEMAFIKIVDGIDIPLKIVCQIPEPRCMIRETELDFHKILINTIETKSFTIRNASKSIAVYEIDLGQLDYCLGIDQVMGKIPPESCKQIHLTFKIDKEVQLRSHISVHIRAGATIELPILATTVVPFIDIQQPILNFGTITIMSSNVISITIENKSEFFVDLMLDLTEQAAKDCLSVWEEEEWMAEEVLEFCMKTDEKRTFQLKFESSKVKYHSFQLPLYLPGKIKTKSMARMVQCNVQKTRLIVEPAEIKFQKAIISEEVVPMLEVFRIHNTESRQIRWKLEEVNSSNKVFKPEPEYGWLNSGQSTDVIMRFVPRKEGATQTKFLLKILDETNSMYSNELQLKVEGQAAYPKILFDKKEIIMPVVPLGIESRTSFKILNDGYSNAQLMSKFEMDESLRNCLNIHFPEGKKISPGRAEVPVYLTFVSKASISFSAKLDIFDNTGKCYPIVVSGTSDNSLLTSYPYLEQKLFYYTIYKKSTQQLMIEQFAEPEPMKKLHQFHLSDQATYKNINAYILKWLRISLGDDKLMKFPDSVIEMNGEPIFKLIYMVTGQREMQKNSAHTNLQNYTNLLKMLKGYGCLLNHIRGYYLLREEEYWSEIRADDHVEVNRLHPEYTYWYKSNEAWTTLVLQIINTFKLDFLANKKAKTVEERYSNIYSPQQLSWIKWIETFLLQSDKQSVSITRLKDSFADGSILGSLLFEHLPHKADLIKNIRSPPCKVDDIKHNFKQIKDMLRILDLQFYQSFAIEEFGDKEYLLLIRYLYNLLPHYIPKSESIYFTCEVGEEITKTIDIINPSNKSIVYSTKIIGNEDFSVAEETVKVEAKKTYKLLVRYKCTVWKESKAYLILSSKKEGLNLSPPSVFELNNEIIKKTRSKKLDSVNCTLYESTAVRIDLDKLSATREVTEYSIFLKEEDDNDNLVPTKLQSFMCDISKVRIIKDIHSYIEIMYAPKSMRSTKCFICFSLQDKQTYTFELIGTPELPKAQIFRPSQILYVRKPEVLEVPIPIHSLTTMKQIADLGDFRQDTVLSIKSNLNNQLTNYVTIPHEVSLKQKLKIHVKSEHSIRDLNLDIVLVNDSLTDVRRLKIILNIVPQMVLSEQMKTTAGCPVFKDIMISNKTDKDWKIQTKIVGNEFKLVSQFRDFLCKKGGESVVQVVFEPSWICVSRAKLEILNLTTNEIIEYQLIGVSEQPIQQRVIELKCKLRQVETFLINVQSPFDVLDYNVEIDLMGCHGNSACSLNSQKSYYNLTVNPILTGISTGSLIFYTSDRRYFWYKLLIITEDVQPSNSLKVETTVGMPIELDIKIENKNTSADYFSVEIEGEQLYGKLKLEVGPRETVDYKLVFSPTREHHSKGHVIFRSILSGEQSYYLELHASRDKASKQLECILCQLGEKKTISLFIENPLHESTTLTASVNNRNFTIKYPEELPENSKSQIEITYKPTVLQEEQCQIILNSKKLGRKIYTLKAKSMSALKKSVIDFMSPLGQQENKLIQIKQSPYDTMKVELSNNEGGFEIKQITEENKLFNILVSFSPTTLREYNNNLSVLIGSKPAYIYQLKGHVSVTESHSPLLIQGKCRVKSTKYLDVYINNIDSHSASTYTFSLEGLPDYVNKVVSVRMMNDRPLTQEGMLRFEFKIEPEKPFQGQCELYIYRSNGGLWIFKVDVRISPPEPEETIELETKIKSKGTTMLKLAKLPSTQTKYECTIIGQDKEFFEVTPRVGTIGSEPPKIMIEFEPTKLLKTTYTAQLNIITEDYLLAYSLKGTVPVYHPPKKGKRANND